MGNFQRLSIEAELKDSASAPMEKMRDAFATFYRLHIEQGVPAADAIKAAFSGLLEVVGGGVPTIEQARAAYVALGGDLAQVDVAFEQSTAKADANKAALQGVTDTTSGTSQGLQDVAAANDTAAASGDNLAATAQREKEELAALEAQVSETTAEIREMGQATDQGGGLLDNLGNRASGAVAKLSKGKVGVAQYAKAIYDMAEGEAEGEGLATRLTVAIERQGEAASEHTDKIDGLIAAGERLGIVDDATRRSLIQTIGILQDVQLGFQATAVAMDMTAERGGTLESNTAALVGMMATGGQRAERWGIQVREGASAYEVLQAAQARYSGASVAFAATQEASFKRVGVAVDELKDTYGKAANTIIPILNDIGAAAINNFAKLQGSTYEGVGSSYAATFELIKGVFEGEGLDTTRFAQRMEEVRERVQAIWEDIEEDSHVQSDEAAAAFANYAQQGADNFAGFDFSATLAEQMDEAASEATSGTERILAALDIGDEAGDIGTDIGEMLTAGALEVLDEAVPTAGLAAALFVSAFDKSEDAGVIGNLIGTTLADAAEMVVGSRFNTLKGTLETQLNNMLEALGADNINLPDFKFGAKSSAGAIGLDFPSDAQNRGSSLARAAAAAANATAGRLPGPQREWIEEAGNQALSAGSEVVGGVRREGRAATRRKAKASGKSAEQALKERERLGEQLLDANQDIQDAIDDVFEYESLQEIGDAEDKVTEAVKRKTDVTDYYTGQISNLQGQIAALHKQEEAANEADIAAIESKSDALEQQRIFHEALMHSMSEGIRDTTLALQDARDAAEDAYEPLEADVKAATDALDDLQAAAAAAAERTAQSLYPLEDSLYNLNQAAEQTLGEYDTQLQGIGDRLYELAQAETEAMSAANERVDTQQRIVDAAQKEADAIGEQLDLLRQQESSYDRLNSLKEAGQQIGNLQASLANATDPLERARLEREIAEAETERGFRAKEHGLIGQQEAAQAVVGRETSELEAVQERRDAEAASFAERRALLEAEQAEVSRARELAERSFSERREVITAEIERITREQQLTDRQFHLQELQAQAAVDKATDALEDEQEKHQAKIKPLEDQLIAQQRVYEQFSHNASEADRTATLEIASIQRRVTAVNDDYNNRRTRLGEDIELLQGHQKAAEGVAQEEIKAAQGALAPLEASLEKWRAIQTAADTYGKLTDALTKRDDLSAAYEEAGGNIAALMEESGKKAAIAAPQIDTLATKTGTAATSTDAFVTALGGLNPALSTLATEAAPGLASVFTEYEKIFGTLEQGGAINTLMFDKAEGFFTKYELAVRAALDWEKVEIWESSMNALKLSLAQKITDIGDAAELPAKGVGTKIGAGVVQGLTDATPSGESAIEAYVNALFAAADKAAESHSPSERAAREVGEPIGMGTVVGLERTRGAAKAAGAGVVNAAFEGMELAAASLARVAIDPIRFGDGALGRDGDMVAGLGGMAYTGPLSFMGRGTDAYLPRSATTNNTSNFSPTINLVVNNNGSDGLPEVGGSRAKWQRWIDEFAVEWRYYHGGN